MRLHRLQLGALGPFAAAYDLDLDAVASSGLFLLEGPTGAGKSSVLDAITFALYGALAGRSSSKDRLHTDFATALEPFVELEFSVGGVRHRIRRTPTFARPKRNGSGTTTVQSSVRLWRQEAEVEVVLSTRLREADDEVRRLLGNLSAEQFRQVVVLPQGEFATFLRAEPDERRQVLARLFATDHYQVVEQVLGELRRDAHQQVAAADARVRDALAALRQASGDESLDIASLAEASDDVRRLQLDLLEDVVRAESDLALEAEQAAAGRRDAAARDHAAALERAEQREILLRGDAEQARLRDEAPIISELDDRRRAAERAQSLSPVLAEVSASAGELEVAEAWIASACVEPGLLHADDCALVLDAWATGDARPLRRAAAELLATAAELEPVVGVEAALSDRLVEITDLDTELSALIGERIVVSARVEETPAVLTALRRELDAAREAASRRSATAERLERARARLGAWSRLPVAVEGLRAAESEAREATDRAQDSREAYQVAVAVRLAGMAAELAGALVDGVPCTVCGAAEHPHPASASVDAVDAVELARLESRASAAAEARLAAGTAVAAARAEWVRVNDAAGTVDPAPELHELAEQLMHLDELAGRVTLLVDTIDATESTAHSDAQRVHALDIEITLAEARAAALAASRESDNVLVERARNGHVGVAERLDELRGRRESLDTAAEAVVRLGAARDREARARRVASAAVREAGFTDSAAAEQALSVDVELVRRRIDEHHGAWAVVTALLADPALAGASRDEVDTRATGAAQASATDAYDALRAAADAARSRARDVHACRALLAEAEHDTGGVRAATRPVIRVADAAAGLGIANPRRLTLSTYVLRERFESVVLAASRRLELMSSGRFVLERDDTVSGAKKSGLGLLVLDQWTGTRRDTRTLSGGESFYASLALALGLADTVREEAGGVELETLFIDEGFGSLDPEALESVLDVIDALRDGGRVVGIVSHVHELKERIPDRIEVRRLVDGTSALAVRA